MRHNEDKQLRDFEIRQWYYTLRKYYINSGIPASEASMQAYEDIGLRYCLRKTSIRKAKNDGSRPRETRDHLMIDVKENLKRLKEIINNIESIIK